MQYSRCAGCGQLIDPLEYDEAYGELCMSCHNHEYRDREVEREVSSGRNGGFWDQ